MSSSENQPGCFGVPSVFSFKAPACAGCPARDACQEVAYAALMAAPEKGFLMRLIREHDANRRPAPAGRGYDPEFTVPEVPARNPSKSELTPDQEALIQSLPKKAGTYLRTLLKRGILARIRKCALAGINPFPEEQYRPAHLAYELLMRGGFTKRELRLAYASTLGWKDSAAAPQVTIIWQVFQALEIGAEAGCRMVAHPMLAAQNQVSQTQ